MRPIDADRLANSLKNNLQSFEEMISEHGKGIAHGTRMALNRIAEQPTISPESLRPQWIPVIEKLPAENGNYIVTACDEGSPAGEGIWYSTVVVVAEYYGGSWTWYDGCCEYSLEGIVTHWLPLPEPYTADAEENEGVQPAHWEKANIPLPYQIRTVPTPSGTFAHREMYVCSACGEYSEQNTRYCPHCGARMGEEEPE